MSVDTIARGLSAQTRLSAQRRAVFQRLVAASVRARAGNPMDAGPYSAVAIAVTDGATQAITAKQYRINTTPNAWRLSGGIALQGTDGANPFFRFGSARMPNPDNISQQSFYPQTTTPPYRQISMRATFVTDEPDFEIVVVGAAATGGSFRILVDGQFVARAPIGWGGNQKRFVRVKLGDGTDTYRAPRTIEFEASGATGFYGVNCSAKGSVTAPSNLTTVAAAFIGDSYSAGTGPSDPSANYSLNAWTLNAARRLGWNAPTQQAVGGTGYIATNSGGGLAYADRLADLDWRIDWDVVVIAGGYNDAVQGNTSAAITAAALAHWQAVRRKLPGALIVVTGVWSPPTGAGATGKAQCIAAEQAIAATFAAWGDPFALFVPIATMETPWLTGTGTAAATTGDGNADVYVVIDKVHPTLAGHDWLSRRFAAAVESGIDLMARALR